MSEPVIAGVALTTKVIQPGYPRKIRDDAGRWSLEYLYAVAKASFEGEAPAHGAAAPAPEVSVHTTVTCSGVETVVRDDDPVNVLMRVFYVEPSRRSYVSGSETVRSSSAAVVWRAVEELGLTDSQSNDLKDTNRTAIPYFTVSYHRRSHDGSFAWTEAEVVDGLGKRSGPTGMSTPTADLWLKTERNTTEVDGGVEVEDVWTYDENGWDTVLYGT